MKQKQVRKKVEIKCDYCGSSQARVRAKTNDIKCYRCGAETPLNAKKVA